MARGERTKDLRVESIRPLVPPGILLEELPLPDDGARAVSGWRASTSHFASASRLGGASAGSCGMTAGTPGETFSPFLSYWPRMRRNVSRGFSSSKNAARFLMYHSGRCE